MLSRGLHRNTSRSMLGCALLCLSGVAVAGGPPQAGGAPSRQPRLALPAPRPRLALPPPQAQPVQAQRVQAQPVQAQRVQAQPAQAQRVQAQRVQAQPAQAQPAPAQPARAATANPAGQRHAAATSYGNARLRFQASRAQAQLAVANGNLAAAVAPRMDAARAKAVMLKAQVRGLRAKAKQAEQAGNVDQANQYHDKADRYARAAKRIDQAVQSHGANGQAAAPQAAAPQAAAPQAAAPQAAAPQAGPAPKNPAHGGNRLGDVKKLLEKRDFEGSLEVLQRMEQKASGGGFMDKFQAARARRAIRNEAGRVIRDGAEAHVNATERPRLDLRRGYGQAIEQLVATGLTKAQASAQLRANLRTEAAKLPRREQSAVLHAEKTLVTLARAEQQHQTGPVRRLVSKLASLVLGSASSTLRSTQSSIQARAAKLAKQGPDGALAAHLMMSHAKTVAATAKGLGLDPKKVERRSEKVHKVALKTLSRDIKSAREAGDLEKLTLAYDALTAMRLDKPTDGMQKRLEKDLENQQRDLNSAGVRALDQLSIYAETLAKSRRPEVKSEAARMNAKAIEVREAMRVAGINVGGKTSKRLDRTDDRLNGRDKFGYRFSHAGAMGKAGLLLAGAAKIVYKPVLFAAKVATVPVWGPIKLLKGKRMTPEVAEQKMRGLRDYAGLPNEEDEAQQGAGGPGGRQAQTQTAQQQAVQKQNAQKQNAARAASRP